MTANANANANINLADAATYAQTLKGLDWTAPMADRTPRSYYETLGALRAHKDDSHNHQRLFELAMATEGKFTWWTWDKPETTDEEIKSGTGVSREEMFEACWRWLGAYLWVQGVKLAEAELKALVGQVGEYTTGRYQWSRLGRWNTEAVNALLAEAA